ncbi:DUF1798 family protein [Bacillus testis]|uniref:DUF1798 family protein n=1 Tax=Bacillus testis TaxID=1622072 RepID=UPI00067EE925|nr:DUF1798 family protein [Bacillus testis]
MEKTVIETQLLYDKLQEINDIYDKTRQTQEEYDFYEVVEPFANEVKQLSEEWLRSIKETISLQKGYIYGEKQLDQVVDNMCQLSVQAFHYKSSYNRFKSYVQSTKFLLSTLERQLKS